MSKNLDIIMLFDFYRNILTEKQIEVIDLYYNEDLSLAEISEHLNITRQGIRDNIKRAEAALIDMENRLNLVEKHKKILMAIDKISKEIAELEENEAIATLPSVTKHILNIKQSLEEIDD
ncbi:MAG: YlxM family DNA-binding protein [Clostridia bacterium]|nr:YlxM family DNA-binding protein [Clostridia bacterium]